MVSGNGQHTGVDNVHGTHGTTGVVEDPFLVEVDEARGRSLTVQLVHNVANHTARVISMCGDAPLSQVVQVIWREDVERIESLLEEVHDRAEKADQHGQDCQEAAHIVCAATGSQSSDELMGKV